MILAPAVWNLFSEKFFLIILLLYQSYGENHKPIGLEVISSMVLLKTAQARFMWVNFELLSLQNIRF